MIIDIACPNDFNVCEKEQKKIIEYQGMRIKMEKMTEQVTEGSSYGYWNLGTVAHKVTFIQQKSTKLACLVQLTSQQVSAALRASVRTGIIEKNQFNWQ